MTDRPAAAANPDRRRPATAAAALTVLLILMVGAGLALHWNTDSIVRRQGERIDELTAKVDDLLGEVTRMRIEQSAAGKGPQALIEKLQVYASLAADSRTSEPDYQNARREMQSILRAFEASGQNAWQPIQDRLAQLDPSKSFDEIKWLLEASMRVDEAAAKQMVKEILLGHRMPNPRLRWWAADLLTREDSQLAGRLLRQVLLTESSRGVNPDRIGQYPGMSIPDPAAYAQKGFNNFVQKYLHTGDPKIEDTLLMLLGRVEHDAITIQDCIKALGDRKCQRAVEPIKHLYANPPLRQQNPLFLNYCVRAVFDIQGCDAKAWLEEVIANAPTPEVAGVAADLLEDC